MQQEIEISFLEHSQPVWFKVLKYVAFACMLYFFWGSKWLWATLPVMLALSILLHFWYRYKIHSWKKTMVYGATAKKWRKR